MKILVTGFEPWGDRVRNPSGDVARSLEGEAIVGANIVTAILPVVFGEDVCTATPVIETHKPDAVLSLGVGDGNSLRVERVGINLKKDGDAESPIDTTGPDARFTTLPTREMVDAILAAGVPAQLSHHAGTFLCNHILYSLLERFSEGEPFTPSGFIHVPPTPDMIAASGRVGSSMAFETIRAGVVAAVASIVSWQGNPKDV